MKRIPLPLPMAVFLAAALGPGVAAAQAEAPPPAKTFSERVEYRCDSTPAGHCWYVLYTSTCKEGAVKNGLPSLVCTKEFLTAFQLKVGESKTLAQLPSGTRHCPIGIEKPRFPDCAH